MNTTEHTIDITELLKKEVESWISEEYPTAKDINSGGCADFADSFISQHKEKFSLGLADSYDFYDDVINSDMYAHMDKNSPLLLNLIELAKGQGEEYRTSHVFIYCKTNKRFYDAECIEGVCDPIDLLTFQRYYNEVLALIEKKQQRNKIKPSQTRRM